MSNSLAGSSLVGVIAASHFRRAALSTWDAAAAAVKAGTGRARLACVGDSTTAGYGATSGDGGHTDGYVNAYPAQLASILNAQGLPAQFSSVWGFSAVAGGPASHPLWNQQLAFGTGWTIDGTVKTLGGSCIRFTGGAAGTLSFTPTQAFDTIDVWMIKFGSNGSFTTRVDGGASLGTTSTATAVGNGTVEKVTFTVALGTHTVQLGALANGDVYIVGVDTYASASKKVAVWNMGWGGAISADYGNTATFAWTPRLAIAALAPHLTIFNCTINDWNANTAIATYKSQMQTFITAAKASGDVILQTGAPSSTTTTSAAQQATFIAAVKELGVTNACPVIDMTARWQSYSANQAWYYDALHPNQAGYRTIAEAVAPFVRP